MFAGVAQSIPSFGDLSFHKPVRAAEYGIADTPPGGLPASTMAPAAGVSPGQTLTANANGSWNVTAIQQLFAWDNSTLVTFAVGDRLLIREGLASVKNGIWTITSLGDATHPWQLTRATDADTVAKLPKGSMTIDLLFFGLWVSSNGTPALEWDLGPQTFSRIRAPTGLLANAGYIPVVHVYTALGANTWTKLAGLQYLEVHCIGGGGGGGGAPATTAGNGSGGTGGGGGGYARANINAENLTAATYTATVGGGGAGGVGVAGSNGTDSTFAGTGITTVLGGGGKGGPSIANGSTLGSHAVGGAGGTSSGGDVNATGDNGNGAVRVVATIVVAGKGGASQYGGGGPEAAGQANGGAGTQYGGGGGGAESTNGGGAQTGGAGAPGVVVVIEHYGT